MAVPFRRTSKTKKRMRRTHLKKEVGALTTCPKCGATHISKCGHDTKTYCILFRKL